jgi:hypothetical protein
MSNFFKFFPVVDYKFGDNGSTNKIQNITVYANVIDQVINNVSAYTEYYVLPEDRPDTVSEKLYGTPNYHWTFYLANEDVRSSGWPLSPRQLFNQITELYPTRVITTRTKLTDKFKVGQTITGSTTSATATIGKRNLDLGQLFLESVSGTFVAGENITSLNNDGVTETIVATSFEYQYNAAHHYENAAGEIVDIDPEVGPGALLTEVTWYQRLERLNDEKRQMKVIKPSIIREVVKSFRDTVGS